MIYGWNTTKVDDGYEWTVYGVEYQKPTVTLVRGKCATRARAVAAAKRAVMPYRRGANR